MSDHNVEVFNEAAFVGDASPAHEGVLISEPIARLLGMLDEPRTEIWLGAHANATRDRLDRLADQGVIERRKRWVIGPAYWHRTRKGDDWYRVWSDEMARRRRTSSKGPFLDLDQIPDNATFRTFESKTTGMSGTMIQVPHDPVARDLPWEPSVDMVEALGLLSENGGEPVSVNYLVGACVSATDAARMGQILAMLQSMGLAVPQGHGWVRTLRGARMHVTWLMEAEERAKAAKP